MYAKRPAEDALTIPEVLVYSKRAERYSSYPIGLLRRCQRHFFIPTLYNSLVPLVLFHLLCR